MTEGYEKMAAEFLQKDSMGYDPDQTIRLMMLDKLDRIASALEGVEAGLQDINASLDNMDQNLESCISRGVRGDFLCITGNIRTDN